jgi:muramidase (phage lysozyme)
MKPWHWAVLIATAFLIAGFFLFRRKQQIEEVMTTVEEVKQHTNNNVEAFLYVIRFAEGTAAPGGYFTLYGGSDFKNYSDHPYITGEWKGAKLPDKYCIGAGLKPGCITTAAGAYQMTKPTWSRLKRKFDLKDFSSANQDVAAIAILQENDSLEDIKAGHFAMALQKNAKTWASLPGYNEGQPEKSVSQLLSVFSQKGGVQVV